MTSKRTYKLLISVLTVLLLLSAMPALRFTANAEGEVAVGTSLFTNADNVTVTSTVDGLELSSVNKRDTSIRYNNRLYLNGFNLLFQVTADSFDAFTIAFISSPAPDYSKSATVHDAEISFKIEKTADGKTALYYSKTDYGDSHTENYVLAGNLDAAFTDRLELLYDAGAKAFTLKSGDKAVSYTLPAADAIYHNEANLKLGFLGIKMKETAKVLVKELSGQSFIHTKTGYAQDNKAPTPKIDLSKLVPSGAENTIKVSSGRGFTLPVTAYDVITSVSSIRYEVKYLYSDTLDSFDEANSVTTSSSLTVLFDKEITKTDDDTADGDSETKTETAAYCPYYKIVEIKVRDNQSNYASEIYSLSDDSLFKPEDTPLIFEVTTKEDTQDGNTIRVPVKWGQMPDHKPTLTQGDDGFRADFISKLGGTGVFAGGSYNKMQFQKPAITINCAPAGVTPNPELLTYKIWYYAPNSATQSSVDGLLLTASSAGEYLIQFEATDMMGNSSGKFPAIPIPVRFEDRRPPDVTVTAVSGEKYVNQSLTVPSASVTDDMGSAYTSSVKVYLLDADGKITGEKDEDGNFIPVLEDEYTFTPDTVGWYLVEYTVKESWLGEDGGAEIKLCPVWFEILEESESAASFIDWDNPWNIVFLSVAGAAALGLIVVLFIKPEEKED
jgi:hypothetical protein